MQKKERWTKRDCWIKSFQKTVREIKKVLGEREIYRLKRDCMKMDDERNIVVEKRKP